MSLAEILTPNNDTIYAASVVTGNVNPGDNGDILNLGVVNTTRINIGVTGTPVYIDGSLYPPVLGVTGYSYLVNSGLTGAVNATSGYFFNVERSGNDVNICIAGATGLTGATGNGIIIFTQPINLVDAPTSSKYYHLFAMAGGSPVVSGVIEIDPTGIITLANGMSTSNGLFTLSPFAVSYPMGWTSIGVNYSVNI